MADDARTPDVGELIVAGRDLDAARQGALGPPAATHQTKPRDGGPMDPLTQLEQLGPHLGAVVAGLTPADLDRQTPCAAYTVRGVLEHMIGGATQFAAAFRGQEAEAPDLADPLAGFGPALGNLVGAITSPGALDRTVAAPFGDVPGELMARYVVVDGLVHGWDLATATGQAYEPPDELVAEADAFAHTLLDRLRDGETFADAVEPAPDASPIERLANYTGRKA